MIRAVPGKTSPGVFVTVLRGWRVYVPVIVGYAVLQYLLISLNVTPALTSEFLGLVAFAFVLDVLLTAVCAVTASAASRGLAFRDALRPATGRRTTSVLGWSALWVFAISVSAVPSAILSAIVVLFAAAVMPQVVADRGLRTWFRPLRWLPGRTLIWGVVSYLALVLGASADAEFGFLVGDPLAAGLARVLSGVINVFVLSGACVLAERAEIRSLSRRGADPVAV